MRRRYIQNEQKRIFTVILRKVVNPQDCCIVVLLGVKLREKIGSEAGSIGFYNSTKGSFTVIT
mgnify:CR=1 FL=1